MGGRETVGSPDISVTPVHMCLQGMGVLVCRPAHTTLGNRPVVVDAVDMLRQPSPRICSVLTCPVTEAHALFDKEFVH